MYEIQQTIIVLIEVEGLCEGKMCPYFCCCYCYIRGALIALFCCMSHVNHFPVTHSGIINTLLVGFESVVRFLVNFSYILYQREIGKRWLLYIVSGRECFGWPVYMSAFCLCIYVIRESVGVDFDFVAFCEVIVCFNFCSPLFVLFFLNTCIVVCFVSVTNAVWFERGIFVLRFFSEYNCLFCFCHLTLAMYLL